MERKELWITLKLNTNPKESDDKEIVAKSKKMITPVLSQQDWEALADRIALLLKHDWERAKFETYWYRTFWFPRELSPCVI